MKNTFLKVGLCVPSLKIGDVAYNVDQILSAIEKNEDLGILVFPELSLTGYTCGDLFFQDLLLTSAKEGLLKLAEKTTDIAGLVFAVGLPIRKENALYNCAALVNGGKILGLVPKSCLPNYSEFYERRWFASGSGVTDQVVRIGDQDVPFGTDLLFESGDAVLGAEICEDLFVPDKPSTHLALGGANILINLSASDECIGKHEYRRNLVSMQSADCYCSYLYVSSGTDESSTDLVFSGNMLIADNGSLIADEIYPEPGSVVTKVIDVEKSNYNRIHQNTFRIKDQRLYRHIPCHISRLGGLDEVKTSQRLSFLLKKADYSISPYPFIPEEKDLSERASAILSIQAHGLATRLMKTGIRNLVLGVSGGLDSTLALLVLHETRKLVPDVHLITYTLPNKGNTSSLTYQNAIKLMESINCEIHEFDIHDAVSKHLVDIGHGEEYLGENDTTYENAQARMRTYILMDVANMRNGLVIGTGDLSELALGWCTFNGDHMSMYGVNASIPKTLVQYLVRAYAASCTDATLQKTLLSILDTPISPELKPKKNGKISQKTEDSIGRYDLNDFFLFYVLRYGFSPSKILALASLAFPSISMSQLQDSLKRFYQRFFSQAFKRNCLPEGPKVGSLSLSPRGDFRMPSDAEVESYLFELDEAN